MSDAVPRSGSTPYGWIALALLLALAIVGVFSYQAATSPERQRGRVLDMPFRTSISEARTGFSETPAGRIEHVDRIAETRVTDIACYSIADIGDVRLALAIVPTFGEMFSTGMGSSSTVIDSTKPPDLDGNGSGGSMGSGRRHFSAFRVRGVTKCTLNRLPFSITKGEIHISGATVPVGKGRKVVFLKPDGSVDSVIDLEARTTR